MDAVHRLVHRSPSRRVIVRLRFLVGGRALPVLQQGRFRQGGLRDRQGGPGAVLVLPQVGRARRQFGVRPPKVIRAQINAAVVAEPGHVHLAGRQGQERLRPALGRLMAADMDGVAGCGGELGIVVGVIGDDDSLARGFQNARDDGRIEVHRRAADGPVQDERPDRAGGDGDVVRQALGDLGQVHVGALGALILQEPEFSHFGLAPVQEDAAFQCLAVQGGVVSRRVQQDVFEGLREQSDAPGPAVLLVQAAGLGQRAGVVVGSRLAVHGVVAEVRATVPHVISITRAAHRQDAPGLAFGEGRVEGIPAAPGRGGVVGLVPDVVPARPELGRMEGLVGLPPPIVGKAVGDAVAVDALDGAGELAFAGNQGNINAVLACDLDQGAHVKLLGVALAAAEVQLVLDLAQDDLAAARDLPLGEDREQAAPILLDGLEIERVKGPRFQPGLVVEPGGEAAAVPFGADVGAGADDDIQSGFGDHIQEGGDIGLAFKDKIAFLRLVDVPEEVELQSVQSSGLGLLDAVGPQLARDAGVVDGARC